MDIAVATPQGYEPKSFYVEKAKELAARHGSSVQVLRDPVERLPEPTLFTLMFGLPWAKKQSTRSDLRFLNRIKLTRN